MSQQMNPEDLIASLDNVDLESNSDGVLVPTPPESTVPESATVDGQTLCESCNEQYAVWYCEKCEAICQDCWDSHRPHIRRDPKHSRLSYNE